MAVTINSALTLPSGLALPNRLVKAAMPEGLADPQNSATARHATLYKRWAKGGIGLQLTGNVQINRRNLERPGNVVIEGEQTNEQRSALAAYAEAAKSGGGKVIMQLSHAGRQTPKTVNETPNAPGLTAFSCTRPTASCYRNSCRRSRTGAVMNGAGRSRTGRRCFWKASGR